MELQTSDSKKLFKVFDASKRKRTRKKRDGEDDTNSVATDDDVSNTDDDACTTTVGRISSVKPSVQHVPEETCDGRSDSAARDRGSSPSIPREEHHRSPRRHRRPARDGLSLALKSGMASTPRSVSPPMGGDAGTEAPTQEQDSFIYAFLEEAIKRDKKKHRHGRRHEERRGSDRDRDRDRDRDGDHEREHEHEREASEAREHHHRHRRRRDHAPSEDRDKNKHTSSRSPNTHRHRKEPSPAAAVNQAVLMETFAKLCAQMNENCAAVSNKNNEVNDVPRTQSHKSLQCEVLSRRDLNCNRRPERLAAHSPSADTPSRIRSQGNCRHAHSRENLNDKPLYRYEPDSKMDYEKEKYIARIDYDKYSSKIDVNPSRTVDKIHEDDRYRYHPPDNVATRTYIGSYRDRPRERDRDIDRRQYEDDRRRYIEQKTSRSFEVHREGYEEERCRRTARSDNKDKRYDDKYYEKPAEVSRHYPKDRPRRDRYDRHSVASRDDEYRERDRYSERERDSGLSVADGETSTISGRTGRSHYMRAVKQEIAEQRDAMDKMMKLWKELMRCFKGITQTQDKDKAVNESTCENVRESAAAQLRLWRECMRRYETVARDVGDTDARLMEEINKQRSEMSEMSGMWQECLQRYRDISNDFNTLKQQLATSESPTRAPGGAASAAPLASAEGEGAPPALHCRAAHNYPQLMAYGGGGGVGGYPGSPLRGRASAPPAWWWGGEHEPLAPRQRSSRRSSPASRDGRDATRHAHSHAHRNKDSRDSPRYKEKSSKPSAARSEHRRRKR